ncbi:MAG: hypothetical protein HY862_04845 [Chloroflexi bacterium]|nr:hypothetical protein [Chloroflexota bacterium]
MNLLGDGIKFVVGEIYGLFKQSRQKKAEAVHQFEKLVELLTDSFNVFVSQNEQRGKLADLLEQNHRDSLPANNGYDDLFYKMYDQMNEDEKDLFKIIRGRTQVTMYGINQKLRKWADDYSAKTLVGQSTAAVENLDAELSQLRLHLGEWFAKFESNFKNDERRSLVYLDDEKEQGTPFPHNINKALKAVLAELKAE